ncbi:hypothetical protein PsorP6_010924 [Peronosclerospora sorghi]|uniref:Uncharacterized protein n=1 Tax=Peronosclerospora sorghi TaxID=230839 RepID=A0ACC0VVJ9_9STRA|nr:hypothetical protein PsorP6_010924 [Peronosclerospora sorghi]
MIDEMDAERTSPTGELVTTIEVETTTETETKDGATSTSVETETTRLEVSEKESRRAQAAARQREARVKKAETLQKVVGDVQGMFIMSEMSKVDIKKAISLLAAMYGLKAVPLHLAPVVLGARAAAPLGTSKASKKKHK